MAAPIDSEITGGAMRFSSEHGQNIVTENNGKTAMWTHSYHGGKCFLSNPLRKGRKLTITASNSGRFQLCLFSQKPSRQDIECSEHCGIQQKSSYVSRIYRQKGVQTELTLDRFKSRKISFLVESEGTRETDNIEIDKKDIFVFFEIHYGDISIDVKTGDANTSVFDELCGGNIKFSSPDRTVIQLRHPNPKAVIASDRPVFQEEAIHFNFTPIEDATWTYLRIAFSNVSPHRMKFNALEPVVDLERGIKLKKSGSVSFQLMNDENVDYSVNGKRKSAQFNDLDLSLRVYVYLELFRVKVDIHSETSQEPARPMELVLTDPQNHSGKQLSIHEEKDHPSATTNTRNDIDGVRVMSTRMERSGQDMIVTNDADSRQKRQTVPVPTKKDSLANRNDSRIDINGPTVVKGSSLCACPAAGQTHKEHPSTTDIYADSRQRRPTASVPTEEESLAHRNQLRIEIDGEIDDGTDAPILPAKQSNTRFPPGLHSPYDFPSQSPHPDPFESMHLPKQKDPFTALIENNHKMLVNHLEPNRLSDYLVEEKFMTHEVETKFQSQDKLERCRTLLDILMRFPSSKGTFMKAMNDEHYPQPHILEMLGL